MVGLKSDRYSQINSEHLTNRQAQIASASVPPINHRQKVAEASSLSSPRKPVPPPQNQRQDASATLPVMPEKSEGQVARAPYWQHDEQ